MHLQYEGQPKRKRHRKSEEGLLKRWIYGAVNDQIKKGAYAAFYDRNAAELANCSSFTAAKR
jgi:hypothetical protein